MTERGAPWLLLGTGFNRLLTVATQLLVGFLLEPGEVGAFAITAGIVNMLSPFQSADHARLVLQDRENPEVLAASLRNILLLGTATVTLCFIAFSSTVDASIALAPTLTLFGLCFLRIFNNLGVARISSRGRSDLVALLGVTESVARSVTLVASAMAGAGVWSLVLAETAAVIVAGIFLAVHDARLPRGGLSLPRSVSRKLAATLGVSLLVGIDTNVTAVALGQLGSTDSAGHFAFANRIAMQAGMLILPLIAIESIPRLVESKGDGAKFRETSRSEWARVIKLTSLLSALIGLAGPFAMRWFWGATWETAAQMLPWLSLSIALRIFFGLNKAHFEALGRFRPILLFSVLDTALVLGIVFVLGRSFGAVAIVQMLALESLFIATITYLAVRRLAASL